MNRTTLDPVRDLGLRDAKRLGKVVLAFGDLNRPFDSSHVIKISTAYVSRQKLCCW